MFKRIGLALLGIPLVYLVFVIAMRFVGPTPAQARALEVLHASTPPVRGRDEAGAPWWTTSLCEPRLSIVVWTGGS